MKKLLILLITSFIFIGCERPRLENEFKSQDIIREKLCKFLNIKYE